MSSGSKSSANIILKVLHAVVLLYLRVLCSVVPTVGSNTPVTSIGTVIGSSEKYSYTLTTEVSLGSAAAPGIKPSILPPV